ncbi:hypothetical protein ABPG74_017197 [Tetrahymena malaccensis]
MDIVSLLLQSNFCNQNLINQIFYLCYDSLLTYHIHLKLFVWHKYSYFTMSDQDASDLCSALAKCTKLSSLKLFLVATMLQDQNLQNLGQALQKCTNLSTLMLSLDQNEIGPSGATIIGSALANCKNLSDLNLCIMQKIA